MNNSAFAVGDDVVSEEYRGYSIYAHAQIDHPQYPKYTGGAEKYIGEKWTGFQGIEGHSIQEVLTRVKALVDKRVNGS